MYDFKFLSLLYNIIVRRMAARLKTSYKKVCQNSAEFENSEEFRLLSMFRDCLTFKKKIEGSIGVSAIFWRSSEKGRCRFPFINFLFSKFWRVHQICVWILIWAPYIYIFDCVKKNLEHPPGASREWKGRS
jgi:hypothetical protein